MTQDSVQQPVAVEKKRLFPKHWFELQGKLTKKEQRWFTFLGTVLMIGIWQSITMLFSIPEGVFPSPMRVLAAFPTLHYEHALVRETLFSLSLNYSGMVLATVTAVPLGFYMGLQPIVRGMSEKQLVVFRYAPLMVLIGVFVSVFGIGVMMKIWFLATGIFVYLLPTTIQRVDHTLQVHIETGLTCGASRAQMIRTIYWPSVRRQVIHDIKILAATSWTYIIIAEMLNFEPGALNGIGAMAWKFGKFGEPSKAVAILMVIFLIGYITDKEFEWLDRLLNKDKYVGRAHS